MNSLLRAAFRGWFSKRKPVPGEFWRFDDENPFTAREVEILKIERGWVAYRFKGTVHEDHLPMKSFLYCYRPESA